MAGLDSSLFSTYILLLHHYKSDLAHISDFYRLVIGLYKSEMRANNNNKTNDLSMEYGQASLKPWNYGNLRVYPGFNIASFTKIRKRCVQTCTTVRT